jgi:hypothetical protein
MVSLAAVPGDRRLIQKQKNVGQEDFLQFIFLSYIFLFEASVM